MIAGLLGENLASPRTATKTNQNTAFENNPSEPGKSSSKQGFESYVNKDAEAPEADAKTPKTDRAAAEDAMAAPFADAPKPSAPMVDARDVITADTARPIVEGEAVAASELAAAQTLGVPSEGNPSTTQAPTDAELPRGEVLNQDPRLVRGNADANADTALDPRGQPVKLAESATATAAVETRLRETANDPQNAAADAPQFVADDVEGARASRAIDALAAETPDAQTRHLTPTQLTADTATPLTISRDVVTTAAEPLVTLGAAATPTAPTTVSTAGLTPTAPSIPIASPGDLTGIILNALQSGGDAQEQLVVQLDPPELGRVMIDFKFDANGVQQVVVTSENPEALKRLREMHFELTEALRQQGLSDTNMSFRQEAEDHAQQSWQSPERSRQEAQLIAAEDRRTSPSAMSNAPRIQVRDRLDLLL